MQLLTSVRRWWASRPPAVRTVVPASARSSLTRRLGASLATAVLLGAFLVAGGGTAQAAPPHSHRMATWNMEISASRWAGAETLARTNTAVALQDVPSNPPDGALPLPTINGIEGFQWLVGRGDGDADVRYLYYIRTDTRNVGIVTSFQPDRVIRIDGPVRPVIAVTRNADDVMFASLHASSRNRGGDAPYMLSQVAAEAANAQITNWAVLGDFNRDPRSMIGARLVPQGTRVYNSGQATHINGGELDYMASNVNTQNWRATVGANPGSDHWPVHFGALQGQAGPRELTVHASISGRNWDVSDQKTDNGTRIIQYHATGGANQRWTLDDTGHRAADGDTLYRIISVDSDKCVDIDNGQRSGAGDYLNIWECHPSEGGAEGGGPQADTQNWTLEHPVAAMPNLTLLRNNATGLYANIGREATDDGGWVIQWPDQEGDTATTNETFYLHPTIATE